MTLKDGVLDPQGRAIGHALHGLGFPQVGEVRVGKVIELDLQETRFSPRPGRCRGDGPQAPRQHGDRELPRLDRDVMRAGIVVFPGINRERDMALALKASSGRVPRMVWHGETDLSGLDLVVLPGGFSYGDYLRCGAMAAQSPVMRSVRDFAATGRLRPRRLQRFSDPDRSRNPARCLAAKCGAAIPVQRLPSAR